MTSSRVLESNGKKIGALSINSEERMPEDIQPYLEDAQIGCDADYKFYRNNLDYLGAELNTEHLFLQTLYLDNKDEFLSLLEKKQASFFALRAFSERNGFLAMKLSDEIRHYQEIARAHV